MSDCIVSANLFQPTGFKVTIVREGMSSVSFFAQQVQHPGFATNAAEMPIPRLGSLPMPSDTATFGELNMMILCDENFDAYKEMYNWMLRNINHKYVPHTLSEPTENPPSFGDIVVTALSSANNASRKFVYVDALPTSVGDISFEASSGDVPPVIFPATFRYSYFTID